MPFWSGRMIPQLPVSPEADDRPITGFTHERLIEMRRRFLKNSCVVGMIAGFVVWGAFLFFVGSQAWAVWYTPSRLDGQIYVDREHGLGGHRIECFGMVIEHEINFGTHRENRGWPGGRW